MQEKTWTREADGTYSVKGNLEVSHVNMTYLRNGEWSKSYAPQKRTEAERVIEESIAKGQAKAEIYRLTAAAGAEKILEKKRKIFAENRKKWEEPANKREKKESREREEPKEGKIKTEREDEVMAKKVVKKSKKVAVKREVGTAEKVGGIFRAGTALAYLYEVFEDEKPHSKEKVLSALAKHFDSKGLQGEWRIRRFREKGEELGAFALTLDDGTLQLKFGKGGAKKVAARKIEKVAAKSVKRVAKKVVAVDEEGGDERPRNAKAGKAVESLIRRTLANSGKNWTKNKLVEHLSDEFGIEPDDTREAIKIGLKGGGFTYEDGIIDLAAA